MQIKYTGIIATAKELVSRTQTSKYDTLFMLLVDLGVKELRSNGCYVVACCELPIECGSVTLPDHFEELIAITYPTTCTTLGEVPDVFTPNTLGTPSGLGATWYVNSNVLTAFKGSNCSAVPYNNIFALNGNQLTVPENSAYTTLKIWYKSKNVDSDGLMVINADWEWALANWCAARFMEKMYSEYPRYLAENHHKSWCAAAAKIRAVEKRKQFKLDRNAISYIVNSILYDRWAIGTY